MFVALSALTMPNPSTIPRDPRILAPRIQEARKARRISRKQAAEALGISRPAYIALEKGERPVSPEELVTLSSLYGRTVNDLQRQQAPLQDFGLQDRPNEDLLPRSYVNLAVQAYHQEKLTEGALMRFLRIDRQQTREIVANFTSGAGLSLEGETDELTLDLVRHPEPRQ